jgi:hypothetical protein
MSRVPFSRDEDQQVIDLYAQGATHEAIGNAIGRARVSVTVRIHCLALSGLIELRGLDRDSYPTRYQILKSEARKK